MKRTIVAALGAAAIIGLSTAGAFAQAYPTKQVTMIIPFAAGGPTDTVGRVLAEAMSKDLGQQIVIENVGGAGGTVGAARLATAAKDGYTVLVHHIGIATGATLYRKLPYDTLTAFDYVGMVTTAPMTLVARKDMPANDLKGLIDYIKANPTKVTEAHAGIASASHLCGVLFQTALGIKVTAVPYTGTGPAMTDLLGGHVDFMCDQTTNTTGQITANAIKAYAVTTPRRIDALPNLATAAEAGLPNFEIGVWHGLFVPKGTPLAVIDRLNAALKKALVDPTVVMRFAALGTAPSPAADVTPAALKAKVESEVARWKPILTAFGEFGD